MADATVVGGRLLIRRGRGGGRRRGRGRAATGGRSVGLTFPKQVYERVLGHFHVQDAWIERQHYFRYITLISKKTLQHPFKCSKPISTCISSPGSVAVSTKRDKISNNIRDVNGTRRARSTFKKATLKFCHKQPKSIPNLKRSTSVVPVGTAQCNV